MPAKIVLAYVTCASSGEARRIALTLVRERLAACVNVTPVESFFYWKGELERSREWLLLAKTLARNAKRVEKRVRELHSYEVPCIVFYPAVGGFKKYFDWVKESVKKEKKRKKNKNWFKADLKRKNWFKGKNQK